MIDNLIIEDIIVGMRFKALYPVERGDGIEFPEGAYFNVTETRENPRDPNETRYCIKMRC